MEGGVNKMSWKTRRYKKLKKRIIRYEKWQKNVKDYLRRDRLELKKLENYTDCMLVEY